MLPRLEAVELSPGRFVRADPDGIQSVVAAALRRCQAKFNRHPQTQASQFFTNACECEVHCFAVQCGRRQYVPAAMPFFFDSQFL